MNSILLITDAHHPARTFVAAAAQQLLPHWDVLEVSNSLAGLDLVRQHLPHIALVVIDLATPGLDGYDVCFQIRALGERAECDIRVIPFSQSDAYSSFLTEIGCLTPAPPPESVSEMITLFQRALALPSHRLPTDPTVAYLRRKISHAEREARRELRTSRIALLSGSTGLPPGTHQLLTAIGAVVVAQANSAEQLRPLAKNQRAHVLVVDVDHSAAGARLANQLHLPLIVVATTREEARRVPMHAVATVHHAIVDATATDAATLLTQALQALTAADYFAVSSGPVADIEHLAPPRPPVALLTMFAQFDLSQREQEVIWLDLLGWSGEQITELLGVSPDSLKTYWKRVRRKLQRDTPGVRRWAQEQLLQAQARSRLAPIDERSVGGDKP